MFNFFKKNHQLEKQHNDKTEELEIDDKEWEIDLFASKHPEIFEMEGKLVGLDRNKLYHPSEHIKNYKDRITAYNELKEYCFSFGEIGKEYFKGMWQECSNAQNPKFDYIDIVKSDYEKYQAEYDVHIEKYNETIAALKRAGHRKEDEFDKSAQSDGYTYIHIDDRTNIYMNSQNDYISDIGLKCVEYEKTLLQYADYFKNSICPYCGCKIEMPKQKKSCPHCNNKIHIVKGGIKQGEMALKEDDYKNLKALRDDFYIERQYNKNYHK